VEDFEIAAKILKGKRVAGGVRLVVYPASRKVLLDAMRAGYIETLLEAGAAVMAPGCGFCIGRTIALGDGEVVISSQNRNFRGRMGNDSAFIYVASPATVAASAIKGEITDPREVS
jgi:3-isopropylmalate/(R)-2-methylmalate dehydratase large subunit